MHIHHLSRPAKGALVLLLSIAVVLPLIALVPSYLHWQETRTAQRAIDQSYTASVSDTLNR